MRREGGLVWAKKTKPNHGGSVLASEVHVGLFWGIGNPIGPEHARIKVQGGHDQVRHKGELVWAKNNNKTLAPQLNAYKAYMISIVYLWTYLFALSIPHLYPLALVHTPQLLFMLVCAISSPLHWYVQPTAPAYSAAAGSSTAVAIASSCMHTPWFVCARLRPCLFCL